MSDTNVIEEKKQSEDPDNETKWDNFRKSFSNSFKSLIGILILGSCFMYTTKIAMANVIPTNFIKPEESYPVNMNFFRNFEFSMSGENIITIGKLRCQTIEFIKSESIIKKLLNNIKPNGDGIFSSFFYDSFKTFFSMNNYMLNEFFKIFYNFNESVTIVLGGIIYSFILFFLIIFNFFSTFLIFMYNLFGIANNKKLYTTIQKNESNLAKGFINFYLTCFYYWLVIFIGSFFSFILSFIACFFIALYTLISPLTYTYKITSSKKNDEHGIFSVLLNLFTYKKSLIMFLFSLSLIANAGNELGPTFGASSFLAVIILFIFGLLNDNIAKGSDPTLGETIYVFK